jgi:hypothetical protein
MMVIGMRSAFSIGGRFSFDKTANADILNHTKGAIAQTVPNIYSWEEDL